MTNWKCWFKHDWVVYNSYPKHYCIAAIAAMAAAIHMIGLISVIIGVTYGWLIYGLSFVFIGLGTITPLLTIFHIQDASCFRCHKHKCGYSKEKELVELNITTRKQHIEFLKEDFKRNC